MRNLLSICISTTSLAVPTIVQFPGSSHLCRKNDIVIIWCPESWLWLEQSEPHFEWWSLYFYQVSLNNIWMLTKCVDYLCILMSNRDRLPVGNSHIYPRHIARICIYATIYLKTLFSQLVMAIAAPCGIGA